MNTKQIAEKLVEYVRANNDEAAHNELYCDDIISIENSSYGNSREDKGMEAKKAKTKEWEDNISEVHEMKVSNPVVGDKAFAVSYFMDITDTKGNREKMTELAVYQVEDGKIVREEFIY